MAGKALRCHYHHASSWHSNPRFVMTILIIGITMTLLACHIDLHFVSFYSTDLLSDRSALCGMYKPRQAYLSFIFSMPPFFYGFTQTSRVN